MKELKRTSYVQRVVRGLAARSSGTASCAASSTGRFAASCVASGAASLRNEAQCRRINVAQCVGNIDLEFLAQVELPGHEPGKVRSTVVPRLFSADVLSIQTQRICNSIFTWDRLPILRFSA